MDKTALRRYISGDGNDPIGQWLSEADDGLRAAVEATTRVLSPQPIDRWPGAYFKHLKDRPGSRCKGLSEIIIDEPEYAYRILGYPGPRANEFTMLHVFNKRDGDPSYENPCKVAHERKSDVERDWTRSIPWSQVHPTN